MKDVMTYKDYFGMVHYSAEDEVFYGKIDAINDLIMFEGRSVNELKKAFREAVDDYIETCRKMGREPHKSYKGSLNVRISPDVHQKAALKAATMGISLNQLIQKAVEKEVEAVK